MNLYVAQLSDQETVFKLIRQYYQYDDITFDAQEIKSGLRLLLENPDFGIAWLLKLDEKFVGYSIVTFGFDLEFGGSQATLTDLFIEAGYRGKGLGTSALKMIEANCRKLGFQAIELQVKRENTQAQKLYGKAGFQEFDRITMCKRI